MSKDKTNLEKDSLTLGQIILILVGYAVVYNFVGISLCTFNSGSGACHMYRSDSIGIYMIGAMLTMAVFTVYGVAKAIFKFVRLSRTKQQRG